MSEMAIMALLLRVSMLSASMLATKTYGTPDIKKTGPIRWFTLVSGSGQKARSQAFRINTQIADNDHVLTFTVDTRYSVAGASGRAVPRSSDNAFLSETSPLTDNVLTHLRRLISSDISLFRFANSSTTQLPASGDCKTYPNDPEWPKDATWNDLNSLLGGALIKTKPVASYCYQGWEDCDEVQCEWLTANWVNDSYFQ